MEHFPDISQLPPATLNASVAAAVAAGSLYCFLGYRTLKIVICLTGFLLAAVLAGALCAQISQGNLLVTGLGALVAGVIGAVALLTLYKAGVFCLGMSGGAVIAETFLGGRDDLWVVAAVLGAGLAGGVAALVLERVIMTLATAALGAWMIVGGVAYLYFGPEVVDVAEEPLTVGGHRFVLVACWAVLGTAGALCQFSVRHPGTRTVVVKQKSP